MLIRRLISAWTLALAGSLLLPLMSVAAVSGTTYDTLCTTTTAPAEHTAAVEIISRGETTVLQSMASGQSRSPLGQIRFTLAAKTPITDPARLLTAGKADPFHHVFPQRADLAAEFSKRGVDIDKFTMQLPRDLHVDIHRGAARGGQWNKAWEDFFKANPNATDVDVYKNAGKLIYDFEVPGGAVVPYPR